MTGFSGDGRRDNLRRQAPVSLGTGFTSGFCVRLRWAIGVAVIAAVLVWCASSPAQAGTVVTFDLTVGTQQRAIHVDLFDDVTPQTVANFLNYVTSGRYQDTIVHRYAPGFVIQGGGYNTAEFVANPLPNAPTHIPTFESPQNEFQISSNRAGTIAMAKLGGNPNSATSEWFFNLGDNSANLDNQNGGFTVFGWIVGDGLSVLNEIQQFTPSKVAFPAYEGLPLHLHPFFNVPKDAQGNFVNLNNITITETHASYQNPVWNVDVNNDGNITPSDALTIINSMLANGGPHAASAEFVGSTYKYFDTNGDGWVSPVDALRVINAILRGDTAPANPFAAPLAAPLAGPMMAVPEPSSLALASAAALAFGGFAVHRRRHSRRKRRSAG